MREHELDVPPVKNRRRRFDDDEPVHRRRRRGPAPVDLDGRAGVDIDGPPTGDRWSTWDGALHGPRPRPRVGDHRPRRRRHRARRAQDRQGGRRPPRRTCRPRHRAQRPARRQALPQRRAPDVPPRRRLRRGPPGPPLPRDARDGRGARSSAATCSPGSGRPPSSPRWPGCGATASPCPTRCRWPAPSCCWSSSAHPTGRPRRAWPSCVRTRAELADLWRQLVDALRGLARHGLTHGDLSAFNLLVDSPDGVSSRLVVIDLPQVVDVVGNPQGPAFLARDVSPGRRLVRRTRAARSGGRSRRARRGVVRGAAHSPGKPLPHNLTCPRRSHRSTVRAADRSAGRRVCLITSARPYGLRGC